MWERGLKHTFDLHILCVCVSLPMWSVDLVGWRLMLHVLKVIDCGKITCNRIEYDDVKGIYEGALRTFFMKAR